MKAITLKWRCVICGSIQTSHSHERWEMDWCECGRSAVDLEASYMRTQGNIKIIERKEID